MTGWFVAMIWIGGLPVSYQQIRAAGYSHISSFFYAITWPCGIGEWFVKNYMEAEKSR